MKFIITRTSTYFDNNISPAKGAKRVDTIHFDWRTCKSLEEVKKEVWGGEWFKKGKNHRVEKGMVVRDLKGEDWQIEIANLKQLLNLVDKYGDIIIKPCDDKKGYKYEIEIYDDYRE